MTAETRRDVTAAVSVVLQTCRAAMAGVLPALVPTARFKTYLGKLRTPLKATRPLSQQLEHSETNKWYERQA